MLTLSVAESAGGELSMVATAASSESSAVSATATTRARRRAAIPESTTVVRLPLTDDSAIAVSFVPRLAAQAPQPSPMHASTPAPFQA